MVQARQGRWLAVLGVGLSVGLAGGVEVAHAAGPARQYIDFGQAEELSIDQPWVHFDMVDLETGDVHSPGLQGTRALLDTGANGVVLFEAAYAPSLDWLGQGTSLDELLDILLGEGTGVADPTRYRVREDPETGGPLQYPEIGVGGVHYFDLLKPYDIDFRGQSGRYENPEAMQHRIENVTVIGDPEEELFGLPGIVGMPGMMNRRTELDMGTLLDPESQLEVEDISVAIPHLDTWLGDLPQTDGQGQARLSDSADLGEREYSVDLRMWEYEPDVDPPHPTFEPLPFIDEIGLSFDGARDDANMVFDTGAQMTMITMDMATELGIDYSEDSEDVIEILPLDGVGGSSSAALVQLDHLTIPTREGVDLEFSDLAVGVLLHDIGADVEGFEFDGIFGMNLLTSGYVGPVMDMVLSDFDVDDDFDFEDLEELVDGGVQESGFFDRVSLEFLRDPATDQASGRVFFTVHDGHHHVIPEPGSLALLGVGGALLMLRRRRAA